MLLKVCLSGVHRCFARRFETTKTVNRLPKPFAIILSLNVSNDSRDRFTTVTVFRNKTVAVNQGAEIDDTPFSFDHVFSITPI